jgi:hypothetical protein
MQFNGITLEELLKEFWHLFISVFIFFLIF